MKLLAKNTSKAQNFSQEDFTRETVARQSQKFQFEGVFEENHEQCNLNKNSKHEIIKTLSKTYKILKNLFGFD